MVSRIVVISDYCSAVPPEDNSASPADDFWQSAQAFGPAASKVRVTGGYLQRLPLAAVASGLVDAAEIWSFAGRPGEADSETGQACGTPDRPGLIRRIFRADPHPAPYGSRDALAFIQAFGAPDILCVWGLGIDESLMDACAGAFKIYNSIDAPALRIPDAIARKFDLFLTGAEWQSRDIARRIPGARTLVLPIGPAFASGDTFYPTGAVKDRDVVYVACAQPYKRHDILFDALKRRPGTSALLVIGYGDMAPQFHDTVQRHGLDVEIVGPPGIDHDQVNQQINRARVGVVCGQDDGAPAILTEYQLAGLPVLANARLCCGLQFVTPKAGLTALEGADFAAALGILLEDPGRYQPRDAAQSRWGWQASIAALSAEIAHISVARKS